MVATHVRRDLRLLEREVETGAAVHPPANQRGVGRRQGTVALRRHRVLVRRRQVDTPHQVAADGATGGDDPPVVAALREAVGRVQSQAALRLRRPVTRHAVGGEHRRHEIREDHHALERASQQAPIGVDARRAQKPFHKRRRVLGEIPLAVRQRRAKMARRQQQHGGRRSSTPPRPGAIVVPARIPPSAPGPRRPPRQCRATDATENCRRRSRRRRPATNRSTPKPRPTARRARAQAATIGTSGLVPAVEPGQPPSIARSTAASSSSAMGKCTRSGWNRPANEARSVTPAGR